MGKTDYVDMELLDLEEGLVEKWIEQGFVCRRGNQYGTHYYFTDLGHLALTQFCDKILRDAKLIEGYRLQDQYFDEHNVPQSERNYRG